MGPLPTIKIDLMEGSFGIERIWLQKYWIEWNDLLKISSLFKTGRKNLLKRTLAAIFICIGVAHLYKRSLLDKF